MRKKNSEHRHRDSNCAPFYHRSTTKKTARPYLTPIIPLKPIIPPQLTVRVHPTATGRNVGGQRKVRRPQILDVHLTERVAQRLIESAPREHRRYRIGQIEDLPMPLRHLLRPFARLLRDGGDVALGTPQGAHEGTDADAAHHVDGNARLLDGLQHADVSGTAGAAAAQHEANGVAGQPAGDAREVGVHVRLGH